MVLSLSLVDNSQLLANFDLLPGLGNESESLWSLEHQDDRASKLKSSHLFSRSQWLSLEEGR